MTDKLKKCPFCGGEAMLRNRGMNTQNYVVCENCGAVSKITETEADAIKAWNTRKPMDRIVEQLENTKEKCSQAYNAAIFTYTIFEYKGAISGLAHAIAILKGVQND